MSACLEVVFGLRSRPKALERDWRKPSAELFHASRNKAEASAEEMGATWKERSCSLGKCP